MAMMGPGTVYGRSMGGGLTPAHWSRNSYQATPDPAGSYRDANGRITYGSKAMAGRDLSRGLWMPGRSMGGGLTPSHASRNGYWNPQAGANSFLDANGRVQYSAPPSSGGGGGGGNNGGDGFDFWKALGVQEQMPKPMNPHVTSAIPLDQMQREYLPDPVVKTGMAQQYSKHMQDASVQPMLESYGANQENMASAASGQYQPLIQARQQDSLQKAAMATGDVPVQAAMQRHDFGTKGHGMQTDEVLGLAGVGHNWNQDRLQNWNQRQGLRYGLANLLFGS